MSARATLAATAARRAAHGFAVLFATATLAFLVNDVLPSDPARMVAGAQARPAEVAKIRAELGLERPMPVRFGAYLRRLVHLGPLDRGRDARHATCGAMGPVHVDLGRSYQQRRPVVAILGERLPRTLLLALTAVTLQSLLGVALGVYAARHKRTLRDRATVSASLLATSAPTFMSGLGLQLLFAKTLHLLPLDGFGATPLEHLVSVILPASTLALFGAALYTRLTRDEMILALSHDYVRTARAKGLGELGVLRHALRNVLVPLVTVVGLDLGALVGGAAVTETLFRWPGLGSLAVSALLDRDGPVLMGTVLVTSAGVVLATMFVDLSVHFLDPRARRAR
ncbi:MAG: ABC transporter permease [Myxococcales bacterium]|jgi:peptide/nickel transport system permease protein|nr:ABC transporter permease [Myxococcales bacterium]MBL0197248.1 ABC transporter permease [Myxococcales bacterium]HQY62994.1 ABC transporter permease [Polyangiaceae bacterium]